ncbi:hydroxyacylglutathione hydrolase [Pseudahrensia aquimaris]|uniref:Hydroxyacylglutathione hydrolase n=1 Tax=Pseudahrensia aquimaris TaxID=744461 RepID=A0ABW3FH03_9HYPH
MSSLDYYLFPYLADNYGVLIHDRKSGATAAVDAGEAQALLDALDKKGWKLTHLWITHHHWDHTDGLEAVKAATGCQVIGPSGSASPIAGLDRQVNGGDHFDFAGYEVQVISTPGHTTDMINFYLPGEKVVFTGDTLFSLGCGRIFEGTPAMMWKSLSKFLDMPADTVVYSAHEYTASNAAFALTVDPDNAQLQKRVEQISKLRADGKPTVPSTLDEEFATNPFLRASDASIRAHLGMRDASDEEVFTEIRKRKDQA